MSPAQGSLSVRRYGPAPGSHAHDHAQVLVGLDGALDLEVEGRGRRIGAGQGCLILPGERHDFEASGGSRCLVLDAPAGAWSRCDATPRHAGQAAALARWLAEALAAGQPLARLHGPTLLLEAWGPAPAVRGRAIDWEALQAWVGARLEQQLTVADLAARVHLSPGQFTQRCLQAQGLAPMAWLRTQRLARARQLRAQGLPVAEAARRAGYRSPSALTAALRRGDR